MLNITGINDFYYLRDFHDMRCKYDRVLSIIRAQLHRDPEEGEIFIMMSRDYRTVRLFEYDRRSFQMREKRLKPDYRFMKVTYSGGEPVFSIDWNDVVALLESPVLKTLRIS